MNAEHVRIVARQELLDLFRNKQMWVSMLFQPVVFLVMIVAIGYIAEQRGNAFRTKEFKVVVSGAEADVRPLEQLLREHDFRPVRGTDVERTVVGQDAEVGIVVPRGMSDGLHRGERVRLDLSYLANRDQSEVALARARVALEEFARRQTVLRLKSSGLPASIADPLDVRAQDVSGTERGARIVLARMIPGFLLLQSTALVGAASQLLSGRKDKRTLEPLLLLPIARRDILIGAGVASFAIGVIPALAFIVPVVAASTLPMAFASGLGSPLGVGLTLLVVGPLIALLMVALGLTVGVRTRSGQGGAAVGSLVFVPVFGIAMLFLTVDSLPSDLPLYAIPAYGAALFARESIVDGISALPLLVTAASTAVAVIVLLRLAVRWLATERVVLRPSE